MNIADVLAAEFLAAGGDIERGRDRAADAAMHYIVRRLQQLERRFPRHVFAFSHQRGHARLLVFPQVGRLNDLGSLLNTLCGRATRWRTMGRLRRLETELHAVAFRTEHDFNRLLGYIGTFGVAPCRSAIDVPPEAARAYDRSIVARRDDDERRLNRLAPIAPARRPATRPAANGTARATAPIRRSS